MRFSNQNAFCSGHPYCKICTTFFNTFSLVWSWTPQYNFTHWIFSKTLFIIGNNTPTIVHVNVVSWQMPGSARLKKQLRSFLMKEILFGYQILLVVFQFYRNSKFMCMFEEKNWKKSCHIDVKFDCKWKKKIFFK